MQVVPLLLQYSSSNTWPLLALNAVLHAKHPALPKTLRGDFTAVNLALAASLSSVPADGPLAVLQQAAELISAPNSSSSSSGVAAADLDAALVVAEAVDPWAVSMQLTQRVINSLWEALTGSTVSTAAGGSSSSGSSVRINTPEGAAAAWQVIVTDLLSGCKPDVALQLLSGFVNSQDGWEAGLRALAVAAALQRDISSSSSSTALLQPLLARVCKRNRYPALAFLVLLLQQRQVQLAPGDTAVVLDEALQQLLAYYGTLTTDLAGAAAEPNSSSSRGTEGSLAGWLGLQSAGAGCEIDAWGFDALFRDLDVFGDASAEAGPQYKIRSSLFTAVGKSEVPQQQQQQQQQVAMSQVVLGHVESLVKAAVARGHAVAAADFVMQMLALSVTVDAAPAAAVGLAAESAESAGSGAQLVFVVSKEQQDRLLVLAADCCIAALADGGRFSKPTSNDEEASGAAAAVPAVLPSLLAALAAAGQVSSCIDLAVAVCGSYSRSFRANIVTGRHSASMSRGSAAANTSAAAADDNAVTARVVGEAITAAAAAVVSAEGSVSAAKPQGSALLAGVSGALFAADVPVEQCLVLLAAVAVWVEERLALQLVAASAAKLHSVMPQAVAVVRSSRRGA
jgi:hypothetical protein